MRIQLPASFHARGCTYRSSHRFASLRPRKIEYSTFSSYLGILAATSIQGSSVIHRRLGNGEIGKLPVPRISPTVYRDSVARERVSSSIYWRLCWLHILFVRQSSVMGTAASAISKACRGKPRCVNLMSRNCRCDVSHKSWYRLARKHLLWRLKRVSIKISTRNLRLKLWKKDHNNKYTFFAR